MSQYSESYTPRSGESAAGPSATDVARDEAADVGQHARQAGGDVAQTATDQARQVAAETGRQARDLFAEAQGQAREQASAQQQKAAVQLHSVADELHQMADNGGQGGMAADLARQAADRLHGAGSYLEKREPGDLLNDVRSFARRRPGTFLLGAALAGLAAGRMTRGLAAGRDTEPDTSDRTAGPTPPAATPGAFASTGIPEQSAPFEGGAPAYLAEPGTAWDEGYPAGAEPAGSGPAYLGDPVTGPEAGTSARFEGPQ